MSNLNIDQDSLADDSEGELIRKFLAWQCSLRQETIRQSDGRPTIGMCPEIVLGENEVLGRVTVLILKKNPSKITAQFQHLVKKTRDPLERWEAAINTLSSTYFQQPDTFSPRITALFGSDSEMLDRLVEAGECCLKFEQKNQQFILSCMVSELSIDQDEYQATYWHNSMFNPNIPGNAKVLCFESVRIEENH